MSSTALDIFKVMLIVQLFWSFGVTILVATIPTSDLNHLTIFTTANSAGVMSEIGPELETNIQSQLEIPVVDVTTLVIHSGNIVVDLILNFVTAVPEMFTLLTAGIFLLVPIEATIQETLQLFIFTIIAVVYAIAIIQFLANIRSGGNIV